MSRQYKLHKKIESYGMKGEIHIFFGNQKFILITFLDPYINKEFRRWDIPLRKRFRITVCHKYNYNRELTIFEKWG